MNYLLGIDVGTSATKTVLFDEKGTVIASASQEYPMYQPENGWAEQKPEDWAAAVLKTIKEVVSKSGAVKYDGSGYNFPAHFSVPRGSYCRRITSATYLPVYLQLKFLMQAVCSF